MTDFAMRTCPKCKVEKPAAVFTRKDSWCGDCRRKYAIKWLQDQGLRKRDKLDVSAL